MFNYKTIETNVASVNYLLNCLDEDGFEIVKVSEKYKAGQWGEQITDGFIVISRKRKEEKCPRCEHRDKAGFFSKLFL